MLQNIRIKETTANQMRSAGILFLLASIIILLGNLIPSLVFIIICLILGMIMIIISIIFLTSILSALLELKPNEKTSFNVAKIGLVFYMLFFIAINIMVFFYVPAALTITFAALQAAAQFAGFLALNISFQKISKLLKPSDKIDSPIIVIYGSYGILELLMAIIAAAIGTYGAVYAVLWIDLILSFIIMLVLGIVLVLNTEKMMRYSGAIVATPATALPDQPSAKYYAETAKTEETIYCQNCGSRILESDAFCSECGAKK